MSKLLLLFSHKVVSSSFGLQSPWTVARQTPMSVGFPRQENWGGLPFPPSGDLPDPGIEPESPVLADGFFTIKQPGKPKIILQFKLIRYYRYDNGCRTIHNILTGLTSGMRHGHILGKFYKWWKGILALPYTMLLSHFSPVRLCATPQRAAQQAPLSLGFSRQEHWSGLPFPSPMPETEKWKWSR